MKQNVNSINRESLIHNQQMSRVSVVTTDRSQWAAATKFRWIFWMAVLLSAAILFGSCKNSGASDTQIAPSDTAGLAAFNAQKAADSVAALNGEVPDGDEAIDNGANQAFTSGSDNDAYTGSEDEGGAIKSVNDDNAGGDYIDDNSAGATAGNTEVAADPTQTSNTEATTTQKKKFSSAAKGAVIGAGSGAVLGAIISKKNRGLGAVIGAAIGGGAGYGIGKHKDNKREQEGQ